MYQYEMQDCVSGGLSFPLNVVHTRWWSTSHCCASLSIQASCGLVLSDYVTVVNSFTVNNLHFALGALHLSSLRVISILSQLMEAMCGSMITN